MEVLSGLNGVAVVNAGDLAVGAATALGAIVALGAVLGYLLRWYRRTLGRRRQAYERLARLGTGAHLSFFESVLGEPPAIRRTVVKEDFKEWVSEDDPRFDAALVEDPELGMMHEVHEPRAFLQSLFVDRDFFVQTITDADGTVLAFSVTTRHHRFAPTFEWPPRVSWLERRRISKRIGEKYEPLFHVRLGRTRFSDFGDEERDDFAGPRLKLSLGAHNYAYSEFGPGGNPGAYQEFIFTASDVAPGAWGDGFAAQNEIGADEWPLPDDHRSWNEMTAVRAFRRATLVTTYTAVGMDLWVDNFPTTFAPHINFVRTLP
jgi:hypothetical protein